jgi:hypothetical protein
MNTNIDTILVGIIYYLISRYQIALKKIDIWVKRAADIAPFTLSSPMHVLPYTARAKRPVTALKPFLK